MGLLSFSFNLRGCQRVYKVSHEQVLAYYQEVLKEAQDQKLRDRKTEVTIEHNGRLPWQRISVSKDRSKQSDVTITMDSRTWIMGTLTGGMTKGSRRWGYFFKTRVRIFQ